MTRAAVGRGDRDRERGQAMIETTLVALLLMTLFLGVHGASTLINDRQIAVSAARSGARLGAEIGNNMWQSGQPTDPSSIDRQIVQNVLTVARTMKYITSIDEIDIYQPPSCPAGPPCTGLGDLQGSYPVDRYDGTGALVSYGSGGYTLDDRNQTPPNETYIGVHIAYHYRAPLPFVTWSLATSDYAVMQLAPTES